MMITNTAMTIYNKIAGTETYQRTIIVAVMWENRKGVNGMKSGALASNAARVFVPKSVCGNYLTPKAWQALTTKTGKWTIQEQDVIVKGAVTDEIHEAVAGPPVVAAFRISDLKEKYDDVLVITSVDSRDMGSVSMQHFEIGAK